MSIRILIYLLLAVPFLSFGQGRLNVTVYPHTSTSSPSGIGAESIWLFEDDGSDEKDNHTISLLGSGSWSDSGSPPEGDYFLSADCSGCGASVESTNYTSTFTIAGEAFKWGGTGSFALWATMQSNNGWELLYDPANDRLGWKSGNGSSTSTSWGDNMSDLSGSWFMWMAVVDYDDESVQFYINGADAGEAVIDYTPSSYTSTARLAINYGGLSFFGSIDAIQVYTWKLSSSDASTINTTPGTEVTQ